VRRSPAERLHSASCAHACTRGSARNSLLLALVFLLALAAVGYWFYTVSRRPLTTGKEEAANPSAIQLSEATRAVLGRLDAPLEIRFYSILDPASVPASVNAFADRVDRVLAAYQQEAGDKIKVTRFDSQSNLSPNAPAGDGIQAFNMDKGEACFLGITLSLKGRKESLSRVSPDYEQALESDITRAIARLEDAAQPFPAPVAISQVNTAAVQEVRALIPNLAAVSYQEGERMINVAAVKDLTLLKKETDPKVKEAEQRYRQALNGGAEAEQQAARQQYEKALAEQKNRLDELNARAIAQKEALKQLKVAAH
jgi:hypothetical protein